MKISDTEMDVKHVIVITIRGIQARTLRVFLAQFVEDVGGVKAGVVAELARNDLEGLRHRADQQLLLARDGARVVAQELAQLHLNRTAAWRHTQTLLTNGTRNFDATIW